MRLVESWSKGSIDIVASYDVLDELDDLGLTMDDLMTEVQYVATDGIVTGGAEAMNLAARSIWWLRPVSYLYSVPGITQVEDSIYKWVAANRDRMPGGTPSCRIDEPE